MARVTLELIFAGLFAAGAIATVAAFVAAVTVHPRRSLYPVLGGALAVAAAAAWAAFAFEPATGLAVAAGGLSLCALCQLGALRLQGAVARQQRVDEQLAAAESHLQDVVERQTRLRAEELERTIVRARTESISLLEEEERRLAEIRRAELAMGEQASRDELARALADVRQRVEQRLASWTHDLDRAQQALGTRLGELERRQEDLLRQAEGRLADDTRALEQTVEEQQAAILRLREELEGTAQAAVSSASADLEAHAAERRRALHEVADRLRRRERDLRDRIDHEETEAVQRIQMRFADVERRQVEQLQRAVERAAVRYAEAAERRFDDAIKRAREEAARRLARELDRGVAAFARQAEGVLAESLARATETGAQRVEKRLAENVSTLQRQSEELAGELERRAAEVES